MPLSNGAWREFCMSDYPTSGPVRSLVPGLLVPGLRYVRTAWHVAVLLLLCAWLFFFQLGWRDLASSHEARAAQNAQTILHDGNWGLPRLYDGRIELQKPPLYYWLVALLAQLRGGVVGAWAVRLPAALAALGCVLFLCVLGYRCGRPVAGLLAALVLATAVQFTALARVGRVDMPLTLTVTVALGGFWLARRAGGRGWMLLGYAAVALGMLLKGPIAAVLPLSVIIVWRLSEKVLARRGLIAGNIQDVGGSKSTWWWGIPLTLMLCAPWFIWANHETGGRLWEVFFWYHNVERGLGGAEALAGQPWWFYFPRLLLHFLPWSVMLPAAGWIFLRRRWWRDDADARFGLAWFCAILLFLSCMRFKRMDYLLPALPGLAWWLGTVAERWWRDVAMKTPSKAGIVGYRLAWAGLAAVVVAVAAGWGIYVTQLQPRWEEHHSYRRFAAAIRQETTGPVIFFRAEAHEVAFHVGRPLDTILEWENLAWWATRPQIIHIVMPPDCAAKWRQDLPHGRLEEVLRTTDLGGAPSERPLVLLRSVRPKVGPSEGQEQPERGD